MRKSLNGKWLLSGSFLRNKQLNNLEVTVPGSIYNDLLRYGLIEEPYYRANESLMLDYVKDDYEYTRTFKISKNDLDKEINLVFLGLDTVTEIYVNEKLVAKTYNMHRRYVININDYVKVNNNELKVIIKSCLDFIKEEDKKNTHELMNMSYAVKGYATIRKAHAMFGWDWGPQMPDGGIWRDCFLEIVDSGKITDCIVFQDTNKEESHLLVKVTNHLRKDNCIIRLKLSLDDYNYQEVVEASSENEFKIDVKNPSLWYPVGYGKQPLYLLEVELIHDDEVVDSYLESIGLRKMEVERIKDEYGESFTVKVNGKKVFIKGSDYIIEDNILPRTSLAHTEYLLDSMLFSNQNCIRVWGGGLYPANEFYELCDEKGILVWQDLMFACGYYNMENDFFVSEIKEEIVDNIKRIHNHPCIILICGNNENETAALDWNVPSVEYTKKWYLYQYEELIPALLKSIAPDLIYWPSSPSSGGGFNKPNSDAMGDMHYWGVWHNNEPIENYRKYYPRLLSEFGMQSFPSMKTIKAFTEVEDRNIYSFVMERHQKNLSANQKIMNYIGSMFKYPKDLEYISYVSQLIQAIAVKYCVEHLRRNYPRCMGAIYWQLNDCWPVASWSSIDYYGRYKALQYASKKFYAPVLVSIEENNQTKVDYTISVGSQDAKIVLTNELDCKLSGSYKWVLTSFDGKIYEEGSNKYQIDPLSVKTLETLRFDLPLELQMNTVLRVQVFDNDNNVITENEVSFLRDKHLSLRKPNISYHLEKSGDKYNLHLASDTYTKYVFVDLKYDDVIFSDNYFSLYKGEEKVISFEIDKRIKEKDIKIINLVDSY